MFVRIFFLLTLIALATACTMQQTSASEVDCVFLVEPSLLTFDHDAITEADVVEWIQIRYDKEDVFTDTHEYEGAEETGIYLVTRATLGPRYEWQSAGRSYEISFDSRDGTSRLSSVGVTFADPPTLGNLETCFGLPEFYRSSFFTFVTQEPLPIPYVLILLPRRVHDTSLDVYYPDQGLIFWDSQDGNEHTKPTITENTTVEAVTILRKGELLDQIKDSFPEFESSHNLDGILEFPGTWEEMNYLDPPQRD